MERLIFTDSRPSKAETVKNVLLAVILGLISAALWLHWFGVLVP